MKIAKWNDINFWALKSAVEKTRKTLHKHMKEFEKGLGIGVQNFLNANIKDWITEGGDGVWDKDVIKQLNVRSFVASESMKVCMYYFYWYAYYSHNRYLFLCV